MTRELEPDNAGAKKILIGFPSKISREEREEREELFPSPPSCPTRDTN